MAMTGVIAFSGQLRHCLVVRGGWFDEVTYPISLKPVNESTENQWEDCKTELSDTESIFELNKTIWKYVEPGALYEFNYDNVIYGFQSVIHTIFGDEIWSSLGLLTGTRGVGKRPAFQKNLWSWFYVALVLLVGYIIDALVFSVIVKNVEDKLSFVSI